jgi:cyclohexa-1,5-dienecarbonyl-CoA hydratase
VGDFPGDIAKDMKLTGTEVERVSLEIQGHVARITLRNPPLNIIDIAMMEELASALAEIESQPDTSIVIFQGEGSCFSAGVDVAAHTPDKVASMLEKFHRVIRTLIATKKATMAVVHGHCLGGGAELAMVCDLVYTTGDAQWGFPEIQLGCFPPVAATALSALIGQKRASDLILTGRTITGVEAAANGLANSAVTETQLENAVDQTIKRLSALSPAALAITKKAIYAWDSMHFDKGLARAENIYVDELMKTEDANEGIKAFMEKRTPQWKGQ